MAKRHSAATMHDIKFIREKPEAFDAGLARRGLDAQSGAILALDAARRAVATAMQEAQGKRNEASKAIGAAMGRGDKDEAERLKAEVAALKDRLPQLEQEDRELTAQVTDALARIPNLPAADVPEGEDEADNVEVLRWGSPRTFAFTPREHADIGPALGLATGFAFGALLLNTAGAIVLYFVYSFVLPGLFELGASLIGWFGDLRPWIDFSNAQGPLMEGGITGEQWAQLGVSSLLWFFLPLALGLRRVLRAEVK